jgi:hypothetical protein
MEAEMFLRDNSLPYSAVVANDDPIAQAGVKQLTGAEDFPVLCCTLDRTIVRGFNLVEYKRLLELYRLESGAGAVARANPQQHSDGEAPPETLAPTPGVN